jgi:hypothetical protein
MDCSGVKSEAKQSSSVMGHAKADHVANSIWHYSAKLCYFDEAYMSISAIPAAAISHWNRSLSGLVTSGTCWTIGRANDTCDYACGLHFFHISAAARMLARCPRAKGKWNNSLHMVLSL